MLALTSIRVLSLLVAILLALPSSGCTSHPRILQSTGTLELDKYLRQRNFHGKHTLKIAEKFSLMMWLMSKHRYSEALPISDFFINRQPIDPWQYACSSCIKCHLGRFEEGVADAETSIKQDAAWEVGYAARADCLYQIGIRDKNNDAIYNSIEDYQKALTLNPVDEFDCVYRVGIANGYIYLGHLDKALKVLKDTAWGPVTREVHELRSTVYSKRGNVKDAEREKKLALESSPATYVGPNWHQID